MKELARHLGKIWLGAFLLAIAALLLERAFQPAIRAFFAPAEFRSLLGAFIFCGLAVAHSLLVRYVIRRHNLNLRPDEVWIAGTMFMMASIATAMLVGVLYTFFVPLAGEQPGYDRCKARQAASAPAPHAEPAGACQRK